MAHKKGVGSSKNGRGPFLTAGFFSVLACAALSYFSGASLVLAPLTLIFFNYKFCK